MSETYQAVVGGFGGDYLDAGVLLMLEVEFIDAKSCATCQRPHISRNIRAVAST